MSSSRQSSIKKKRSNQHSDDDTEANQNGLIATKDKQMKRNTSGGFETGTKSPLNEGADSEAGNSVSKRRKSQQTKDNSRNGRDRGRTDSQASPGLERGRSRKDRDEEEKTQSRQETTQGGRQTASKKKPATTTNDQVDFKGLSQEYPSFELLWFDIMTKSRHLIQEIMDPIVDRLVQQKDTQNQMQTNQTTMANQIQELKDTIYNTGSKLDIFEKINQKMSNLDSDRRLLEEKVDYQNNVLTTKMDNTLERLEVNQKLFDNMQQHTKQVQNELIQLKETYREHSENFVYEIKKLNDQLIKYVNETHLTCENLTETTKTHSYKLQTHLNEITTLQQRCTFLENDNKDLRQISADLDLKKLNRIDFQKKTKKMDLKALEHDIKLFKAQNHCSTLDNYLEKYMPIHVQTMINDTLMSTLGGRERRRLELYDSDKNSLLYQQLLMDDGTGKIQELMRELHEKASAEIEKQEKLRKRRMAITEASKTNNNPEMPSYNQTEQAGINQESTASLKDGAASESQDASVPNSSQKKSNSPQGVQIVPQKTSSPQEQTAGDDDSEAEQQPTPAKPKTIIKPQTQQQPTANTNMIVSSAAPALPNVVLDDFVYRLTDLINSDFKMPETDKDYELSHAQLIKICKILLYKLNLVSKKNAYEREELANMINDRVTSIENLTKSSLEEVNTFLHTVHQDFEHFLTKHKREHTDLNMKVMKCQEDMQSFTSQLDTTKKYVDNYATILSCVVEFQSIEQCLSLQDEDDRHQIALVGKNKMSKQPEDPFNPANQGQSIFGAGMKDDIKGIGVRGDKKQYFNQPIKGLKLSGSAPRNFRNQQSMHSSAAANHNISIATTEVDDLKDTSIHTSKPVHQGLMTPIKAGSLTLDQSCLSCTGQPSHLIQLFKLACLSYNPSRITYRKSNFTRLQLMQMRRTLIEKCEEIINSQRVFINLQEGQDLRTDKLFRDLLQFHSGERSAPEIVLSQDSIVSNQSPSYSASFIPAISQKNFKAASNDSIAGGKPGQQQFVNVVQDEGLAGQAGPWSTSLLNKQNHNYTQSQDQAAAVQLTSRLRSKNDNIKLPSITSPSTIQHM